MQRFILKAGTYHIYNYSMDFQFSQYFSKQKIQILKFHAYSAQRSKWWAL